MSILKRYRCDVCGSTYRREVDLMNHVQTDHGQTGYDCRACNETFPDMESMRTHIQRRHPYIRRRGSF